MSYKHSHTGKNYGEYYDEYLTNKYEAFIFKLEKNVLSQILKKHYPNKASNSLDFACGTGRVTKIVEENSKDSYGLDISEDMLKVAKKKCNSTKFLQGDVQKEKVLGKKFYLITAFRFFLNAEYELKEEILKILRNHLKDNGKLIFDIHENRYSIVGFQFFLRRKLLKKKNLPSTMSITQVKKLLKKTGYRIVEIYPLSYFPGRLNFIVLPERILKKIELFLTRIKVMKFFAKNIIFVCEKREKDVK